MPRKKEGERKVADRPLSRNLDYLLRQPPGFTENLKLAEKSTGIDQRTIRKYVTGDRNPEWVNLEKLCVYFNLRLSLILEDPAIFFSSKHRELIESVRRIKNSADIDKAKQILDVFISPSGSDIDHKLN